MQLAPDAFYFTEHYRTYPAVLIRLAEVPVGLLESVVKDAWSGLAALPSKRPAGRKRVARKEKAAARRRLSRPPASFIPVVSPA